MILAIDPGPINSGWCLLDETTKSPFKFGKSPNNTLMLHTKWWTFGDVAIELPVCQQMSGRSISDTAIQAGIIAGKLCDHAIYMITRSKVRGVLCGRKGNDKRVKDEMIKRFAPGVRNHGKGIKKDPGFFYGFHNDVWQAFALGVVFLDMRDHGGKKETNYLIDGRL